MSTSQIWIQILGILEEQLQKGFLEQAKSVVSATETNSTLRLEVNTDEALEFFSADVNQQRILILGRTFASIETIEVKKVSD